MNLKQSDRKLEEPNNDFFNTFKEHFNVFLCVVETVVLQKSESGRPSIEFSRSSGRRTKRRQTQLLRFQASAQELACPTQTSLRAEEHKLYCWENLGSKIGISNFFSSCK